jgi:hypothetical protein
MNSQQVNKSSRGKAVHLLSAAMVSKKRKKPERSTNLMSLPVSLQGGSSQRAKIKPSILGGNGTQRQ